MSAWTFIAQRATTGEFLDWDLPIEFDSLEWTLSGPGALSGTVAPDVGGLRAADGRLLLEEWGTLIYAESGGEIRGGFILINSSFEGEAWKIEGSGFSTYPHSVVYEGEYSRIGVDPVDAFKEIWANVQSFPDANLGVTVTGDTTPVRLGKAGSPGVAAEAVSAAQAILDRIQSGEAYYEDWTWQGAPDVVLSYSAQLIGHYSGAWDDRDAAAAWLRDYLNKPENAEIKATEAEPYELLWWEHPNCGDELEALAKATPFDYVERHMWVPEGVVDAANLDDGLRDWMLAHGWHGDPNDGREALYPPIPAPADPVIAHVIRVGYPRIGRRREDLVFVQGDNVSKVVSVDSNGDEYANTILGLGSGEGTAMLRRSTGVRDGRLRRVSVFADKAITDNARMDALIADELARRKAALRITSLDVLDHPNAPIGSWQVGDDVLVRADLPWLGEVEMWVRITAWSLTSESTATLDVTRSDHFRYGGASA